MAWSGRGCRAASGFFCTFLGLWPSPDRTLVRGLLLADGRYDAKTNPESEAKIALDIAAIKEIDCTSSQFSICLKDKLNIYQNGQNSQYKDPQTSLLTNRSLASLSLNSLDLMEQDDWYNIYRHSFGYIGTEYEMDQPGSFDGGPVEHFGNTIMLDLFDLGNSHVETEGILLFNVWMMAAHYLQEAERQCKFSSDVNTLEANLDRSAAYYIGWGQLGGDNNSGHLLYNLFENAGARFGKDMGETLANKNIITLMNRIKTEIIAAGKCPTDFLKVRTLVRQIVAQMTVPLVQNFIHYMIEQKNDEAEIYALAITPQIAACDPNEYEYFMDKFVLNYFKPNDLDEAISRLQDLYLCFGITCGDVGAYSFGSHEVAQCSDMDKKPSSLAGYKLRTDVQEVVYMDRDILRMRNLMSIKALTPARDIYMYGFNAAQSLQELATSSGRSVVSSEFPLFISYFDDENYADTMIMNAFEKQHIFDGASDEQVSEIVIRALQSMVMYMKALEEFFGAEAKCASNVTEAAAAWDRGASALIGSIEGSQEVGRPNGQFIFALAKELCGFFQECRPTGSTEVNDGILDYLDKGATSISVGDCGGLMIPNSTPLILLLKVPSIQGILHFAAVNAQVPAGSSVGSVGSSHSLYSSINPLIANESAAGIIESNMKFDLSNEPVSDGAVAVFEAVRTSLPSLGVSCKAIGVYGGVDFGDLCANSRNATPTPFPVDGGTRVPTVSPNFNGRTTMPAATPFFNGGTVSPTPAPFFNGSTTMPTASPFANWSTATPTAAPVVNGSTAVPSAAPFVNGSTASPTTAPDASSDLLSDTPTRAPTSIPTKEEEEEEEPTVEIIYSAAMVPLPTGPSTLVVVISAIMCFSCVFAFC